MTKVYIALKPFNNKVFYKNAILKDNSENGSHYLIAAKKLLSKSNIILNTIDQDNDRYTKKDIYMDVPYPWEVNFWFRIIKNNSKSILFIVEPPIVNPFNHMRIFHFPFSKIYTQNDSWVDDWRYFKFFLPKILSGERSKPIPFKNKKLLILMNGNLTPFLPFRLLSLSTKELYTERIKAINFFDTNYPEDFQLYGRGWNKPQRFNILQGLLGYKKYKTYQGKFLQKDKYKILSKFRFSLCFENCETIGYVSEKIIDCFKARCVPVYLGAPDINDHISPKCFIDYRKFNSFKQLAEYLESMNEQTYNTYIKEIDKFLSSEQFLNNWTSKAFAKTFLKAVN